MHKRTYLFLAWSPDGNMLAVLNLSTIILYTSAFKKIAEFDSGPGGANQIAWSPDGKYLAGAGNFLWIWNITSLHWQVLRPFNTKSRAIFSVVWSPDGTRLLTDAGDIWDVKSGKIIATLNHDTVFTSVSWSPDGTYLATAYENFAGLWDAKTYRLQDTLAVEPPLRMEYLAWSADSKSLAGTSEDDQQHEINVWNVESTKLDFIPQAA